MKILAADDDASTRAMVSSVLRDWGFVVCTACDGREAHDMLVSDAQIRMAVLDWMMPGLTGVEVCRRMAARQSRTPVYAILLTHRSSKSDVVEGLQSGASDFIAKPFDYDELHARVSVGRRVVELQNALARRADELQAALSEISLLRGLIPICVYCHKIRADGAYWHRIEEYIASHSDVSFSHGVCPECYSAHVTPQLEEFRRVVRKPARG